MGAKKETVADPEPEFPFNNQYYDLITGKTISRRGVWWTALLLVQSKGKEKEENGDESTDPKEEKLAHKVVIQRWRRFKQGEDGGFRWSRSKDFTISSKNQWKQLKEIVDSWVEDGTWK